MEGAAEEVEGLITQTTDVGDYELVDLNTTTSATLTTQVSLNFLHSNNLCHKSLSLDWTQVDDDDEQAPSSTRSTLVRGGDDDDDDRGCLGSLTPPTVPQSPSTPDLLYHHRHSSNSGHHPHHQPPQLEGEHQLRRAHEHHTSAAATLNRYCASRDHQSRRQQQGSNFLYNNNFHNQSFTALSNSDLRSGHPNFNTFSAANGSLLANNGYAIPPYQNSLFATASPNSNGLATATTTSNGFLQHGKSSKFDDQSFRHFLKIFCCPNDLIGI